MPLTEQSGTAGFKHPCGAWMENHCLVCFHGADDPEKSTVRVISGDNGESAARRPRESSGTLSLARIRPPPLPLWADETIPFLGE